MRHIFTHPERCVAGTIGEPGERAFFIQARDKGRVISVALEKAQVQAIANRLELIVAEVKKSNPLISIDSFPQDDAPLETPVDEEFQVGAISLAWNELDQLLSFELYELEDDEQDELEWRFFNDASCAERISFCTLTTIERSQRRAHIVEWGEYSTERDATPLSREWNVMDENVIWRGPLYLDFEVDLR